MSSRCRLKPGRGCDGPVHSGLWVMPRSPYFCLISAHEENSTAYPRASPAAPPTIQPRTWSRVLGVCLELGCGIFWADIMLWSCPTGSGISQNNLLNNGIIGVRYSYWAFISLPVNNYLHRFAINCIVNYDEGWSL